MWGETNTMGLMLAVQITHLHIKLSIWGGRGSEICSSKCDLLTCAHSEYTEIIQGFEMQEMKMR